MAIQINRKAVDQARNLIEDGQYRVNTQWSQNQPSNHAENEYLDQHGEAEYARWFLAEDTDEEAGTKARYKFPYGDFKSVHHSGLQAAKQRAAQHNYSDLEQAVDELLDVFDRMNAC